jgi:hypothetical protein
MLLKTRLILFIEILKRKLVIWITQTMRPLFELKKSAQMDETRVTRLRQMARDRANWERDIAERQQRINQEREIDEGQRRLAELQERVAHLERVRDEELERQRVLLQRHQELNIRERELNERIRALQQAVQRNIETYFFINMYFII